MKQRRKIKTGFSLGIWVAAALLAAAPGRAQMRGGAPAGRVSAGGVTGRIAARSIGAPQSVGRIGTPLHPNFAPIRGVPGQGFDYQHLAAVSRTVRDRSGHLHRTTSVPFITPIFSGLPYYYGFDSGVPYYSEDEPEQQPPADLPPAPPVVRGPAAAPEDFAASQRVAAPAPEPVPEVGQFILVRRDGQIVMAVAFTTTGGRLTYVTQDGTRRSFAMSELDRDATQQMNEVNGHTLNLPNR